MNQHEFEGVIRQTMDSIQKLLAVKGGEYAGSHDRLANFKRGRDRTGAHVYQVLWIYLSKHLDSVETFIKKTVRGEPQALSEPIEGRLDDIINYCLLMKALIKEIQDANPVAEPVGNTDKYRSGVSSGPCSTGAALPPVYNPNDRPPEHRMDGMVYPSQHRS